MDFILSKLALIGPFFLLLGVLVFVHEWGHFIVARLCGVHVETFSIGFGPKIFKFNWGETNYALSLIPLGGYVKMYGDGLDDDIPEDKIKKSFVNKNVWQKIAIVSAGPLVNLIFAFIIFFVMGIIGIPKSKPIVGDITKNTAAQSAGLKYGDQILTVEETPVSTIEEYTKELSRLEKSEVKLTIKREEKTLKTQAYLIEEENPNPLLESKTIKSIDGLSFLRKSNLVGLNYNSKLIQDFKTKSLVSIVKVGNTDTPDFYSLKTLITKTPSTSPLILSLKSLDSDSPEEIALTPDYKKTKSNFWTLSDLGIKEAELFIGNVQKGSPAAKAGIEPQDELLELNNSKLYSWKQLLESVKKTKKDQKISILVGRPSGETLIEVTPKITEILKPNGTLEYRPTIGIMPSLEYLPPKQESVKVSGFFSLLGFSFDQSVKWVKLTVIGFKKLLFGEVSHKSLSGVISIGKVAKDSLDVGWAYFLQIMAIISINLFLLNLFPIPVLDGGHLLFYFIEVVKGSPVSLKTRLIGQQIGVVVILSLVAYTIFNDLTRIVFSGW